MLLYPREPGKGLSLERDPQRDLFFAAALSELPSLCAAFMTWSAGVGVLSPEAGGLCDGVLDAEAIPLMSMVGEVSDERGVSIVGGMTLEGTGGDLDLLLPDEISTVAEEEKHQSEVDYTVRNISCLY